MVNTAEIPSGQLTQAFRDTLLAMAAADTLDDRVRLSRQADQIEEQINRRIAW